MSPSKDELRKSLKQTRLAMTENDRQSKYMGIAGRLLQVINWSDTRAVHCFEPIMRLGEIDLTDFVAALQTDAANIQIYTSRKIDDAWQIVSVETDKPVVVPQFDAIVVPMLGFDASLQRIGYGGGYYDLFLASQPTAKKIGVCYDIGKVEHIPAEAHDIPVDIIVTENHTYTP